MKNYFRLLAVSAGLCLVAAMPATAQNAFLTNGFMPRFCKASVNYPIVVRVRNSAAQPLISFKVDWRWNNGPVQEGNWQSTTGITGNQFWEYTHTTPFNQPEQGEGVLKVWVQGIGDTDPSNDTLTFRITPLGNWAEKRMLLEQWTGTWCVNCPPANLVGNVADGAPQVVVAKFHVNDEFSSASGNEYFAQYNVTFTPAGVIDQGEYGSYAPNGNHGFWAGELELRKAGVSPVEVSVSTDYNALTRQLDMSVDFSWTRAWRAAYTVNAYIVEDNVPGPQNNAPANYVHQQVVRHVLGGVEGITGTWPIPAQPGVPLTATFSHVLAMEWVPENIRVVGLVTHKRNGTSYTLNAASSAPLVVGLAEHEATLLDMKVYPNPSANELWVDMAGDPAPSVLRLFDMDGREVHHEQRVLGQGPVVLAAFADLAPGAYLLRIEQERRTAEQRVVKVAR